MDQVLIGRPRKNYLAALLWTLVFTLLASAIALATILVRWIAEDRKLKQAFLNSSTRSRTDSIHTDTSSTDISAWYCTQTVSETFDNFSSGKTLHSTVHNLKTWAETTAYDWRWKGQRFDLENTGEINQVLKVFENEDCGCCKYDDEKRQRVLYNNIISSIKQRLNTVNDSKFIVH